MSTYLEPEMFQVLRIEVVKKKKKDEILRLYRVYSLVEKSKR